MAPARCSRRLRTESPEAAAAGLTSAAARSGRVRGPGAAIPRGLAEVVGAAGRGGGFLVGGLRAECWQRWTLLSPFPFLCRGEREAGVLAALGPVWVVRNRFLHRSL